MHRTAHRRARRRPTPTSLRVRRNLESTGDADTRLKLVDCRMSPAVIGMDQPAGDGVLGNDQAQLSPSNEGACAWRLR